MRLAATLAGLSALVLVLSFLRDVLKEERSNKRKWRATVFLGGLLLVLNVAAIGGNWVFERTREDAAKQRDADQSASTLRLHESIQSLRAEASNAFDRLERALASRQRHASEPVLDEEARRVKASLIDLTDSTNADPFILARKMAETRRAVQRFNDALDARGIDRLPSDQVRGPAPAMPDRPGSPLAATEPSARLGSTDGTRQPTRREVPITDAKPPAKTVVVPIVVPRSSGSTRDERPSLQGSIQAPSERSNVPSRFLVTGLVSGRVRHLWLIVRTDLRNHWPQETELRPDGGKWVVDVYVGGPPERDFELVLVDVSDEVSTHFRKWAENGARTGNYPPLPVEGLGADARTLDMRRYRYVP